MPDYLLNQMLDSITNDRYEENVHPEKTRHTINLMFFFTDRITQEEGEEEDEKEEGE